MSRDDEEGIRELLVRLDDRLERLEQDMSKLKYVLLEGNGTPPMTARVAVIENELDRVKEDREDKKVPRAVWVGIIVSIVMGLLSLGMAASG